jgi:hypothetical protein
MTCLVATSMSFTEGETIVARAAQELGMTLVTDAELLGVAAGPDGAARARLERALTEPPSFFGMREATRRRCLVLLRACLATRLLEEGVAYHGALGHRLVEGVAHVVRVRVHAPLEWRARLRAAKEGTHPRQAKKRLAEDDRLEELLASLAVPGVRGEPGVDLSIDREATDIERSVEQLCAEARKRRYQAMSFSLERLREVELELRVRAELADVDGEARVRVTGTNVEVTTTEEARREALRARAARVRGVGEVTVRVAGDFPGLSAAAR